MVSPLPASSPARASSWPMGTVIVVPVRPSDIASADPDSLGAVVRAAREAMGESQTTFGAAVGLTQSQVSQLERGATRTPHLETLRAIADHTGIEAGYLLELGRWPGAFRRGVPAELGEVLRDLDELQTEALITFARIIAGDEPRDHGLSDAEAKRILNYAHHIMQRVQEARR